MNYFIDLILDAFIIFVELFELNLNFIDNFVMIKVANIIYF